MNAPPEASSTRPRRAAITPEFSTQGATSATRPPSAAVISPRLITKLEGFAAAEKFRRPAMKSSLPMFEVLAIRPRTSTRAVEVKITPLGLMSTILPLALSRPAMVERSPPVTRFKATESLDGWAKLVCSASPMLKLRQSMITRSVACMISRRFGEVCTIAAAPPTTVPPSGLAPAPCGHSTAASASANTARRVTNAVVENSPRRPWPHRPWSSRSKPAIRSADAPPP